MPSCLSLISPLHACAAVLASLSTWACESSPSSAPPRPDSEVASDVADSLDLGPRVDVGQLDVLADDAVSPGDVAAVPSDAADAADAADVMDTALEPESPCVAPPGRACGADGHPGPIVGSTPVTPFPGGLLCELSVSEEPPCADGVCSFGDCVTASDGIPDGLPIRALRSMTLTDPECCVDVGGDKFIDNAFGKNLEAAWFQSGFGAFDDTVASSIENGYYALAVVIEEGDPARLWLVIADPLFTTKGEYTTFPPLPETTFVGRPESYVPGTVVPSSRASLGETDPGTWATEVPLDVFEFPFVVVRGSFLLKARRVTITLARDGDDYRLELGGYFLMNEFIDAFNEYFARSCGCYDFAAAPLALSATAESLVIHPELGLSPVTSCGESFCQEVVVLAFSGGLSGLVVPDLDIDKDGTLDAMSFGITMKTMPIGSLSPPSSPSTL